MPQEKHRRLPRGERRQQVFAAFYELTKRNGYPPSRQEVADAVGLASASTVQFHLRRLEADGLIRRTPERARAVEVVETGNEGDAKQKVVAA